jgi:desulfoferrodoxin (superoxide reductase-like protein)
MSDSGCLVEMAMDVGFEVVGVMVIQHHLFWVSLLEAFP